MICFKHWMPDPHIIKSLSLNTEPIRRYDLPSLKSIVKMSRWRKKVDTLRKTELPLLTWSSIITPPCNFCVKQCGRPASAGPGVPFGWDGIGERETMRREEGSGDTRSIFKRSVTLYCYSIVLFMPDSWPLHHEKIVFYIVSMLFSQGYFSIEAIFPSFTS